MLGGENNGSFVFALVNPKGLPSKLHVNTCPVCDKCQVCEKCPVCKPNDSVQVCAMCNYSHYIRIIIVLSVILFFIIILQRGQF